MTMQELFGTEELQSSKPNSIKFKVIKAVCGTMTVKEGITSYFTPLQRYTSSEQVFTSFSFLQQETNEYVMALHLDGKNRVSCIDIISVGSLNQSIVHPRGTFKTALLSSAAVITLVHNHPTGDPTPSREDLEIARRLREAGDLLGVRVLDHIIIGETYTSFADRGLLC